MEGSEVVGGGGVGRDYVWRGCCLHGIVRYSEEMCVLGSMLHFCLLCWYEGRYHLVVLNYSDVLMQLLVYEEAAQFIGHICIYS